MKETLLMLGFKHITGPMWKHDEIGMISINDASTQADLVKIIYERGYKECQIMIRSSLGIFNK